jgi:phosphoglycolate phosphatase-like HAD superfamily hydrolase/predicted metalloenzyme YecM
MKVFLEEAKQFIERVLSDLEAAGLRSEIKMIDHLCYRVADIKTYETLKKSLDSVSILLAESHVNGRPIATFKLNKPIQLNSGLVVSLLEIPAPREDVKYPSGFEHIEVVTVKPLEKFLAQHAHLAFNKQNFTAAINRDVSLTFDGGKVKFHETSLEDVIALETKKAHSRLGKEVVFMDFDDTITNSKEAFLKSMHATVEKFFGNPVTWEEFLAKMCPTFPEFFSNFNISKEDGRKLILEFQNLWPQYAHKALLVEGMQSVLSCLNYAGIEIHVWTARDTKTTELCLEQWDLQKYIKSVHGFEGTTAPSKPIPPPELISIAKAATKVTVIGDSNSDQEGAQALGASFLQAAWINKASLPNLAADRLCLTPFAALNKLLAHSI